MKKVITKRMVLKALRTERLRRGAWFEGEEKPGCRVCAVGAVLRAASFEKAARKQGDNPGAYAIPLLSAAPFFDGLSDTFEVAETVAEGRAACIKYTQEQFPAKPITVDLSPVGDLVL